MMIATTVIHAGAMLLVLRLVELHGDPWMPLSRWGRLTRVSGTVLLVFLAALVEVSLWAGAYLATGAIPDTETALYFSTVTFTTLGYGDVVLSHRWRLLASFEAANGIILFGWSTALVIATVQRAYFHYLHLQDPRARPWKREGGSPAHEPTP
jgi:hypothetical protein